MLDSLEKEGGGARAAVAMIRTRSAPSATGQTRRIAVDSVAVVVEAEAVDVVGGAAASRSVPARRRDAELPEGQARAQLAAQVRRLPKGAGAGVPMLHRDRPRREALGDDFTGWLGGGGGLAAVVVVQQHARSNTCRHRDYRGTL